MVLSSLFFLSPKQKTRRPTLFCIWGEKGEKEHVRKNVPKRWKVKAADFFIWGVPEDGTVGLGEYFIT